MQKRPELALRRLTGLQEATMPLDSISCDLRETREEESLLARKLSVKKGRRQSERLYPLPAVLRTACIDSGAVA
eukprot:765107-Hanusia_phi.AAC.5